MAILEEPIKKVKVLKNYIDGKWIESQGELKDVVNPATGKTIAKIPISTKDELNEVIEAAKEAYPYWRRTTPLTRVRCLFRLKELMEENFEALSRIQTMEHGKTIDESRGETRRGIENVEVAAGIPPGVWNVANGGRTVVSGLLDNPDIKGICFVGSTPTGKNVVYKKCGKTGKK